MTAVGQASVSAGAVDVADTAYSGTATAKFTLPNATEAYTVSFNFSDAAVTTATAALGTAAATTISDSGSGTYVIDATSGLAVKLADGAFDDGILEAGELTVTTDWNNGSDTTITDTNATSWSDGVSVTENGEGNVITYKLDDTHYYKFLLGTNNALKTYTTDDSIAIDGVSGKFTKSTTVAFSTDGKTYSAIAGTVSGNVLTITGNTTVNNLTVKYDSSSEQLTITPGTGTFSLGTAAVAGTTTLDTSALGSLNVTAGTKSNFTSGNGSVGVTLTAPKYESGVSVGGETYSITFGSLAGYTTTGAAAGTSPAAYYEGTITVKAGDTTSTFTGDLTAWLSESNYSLGTNGLIAGSDSAGWYEVTATLGTNKSGKWSYTFSTSTTQYTGARLTYSGSTLTYQSTVQQGTGIAATDSKVEWSLVNNGTVTVTKAAHVDLDTANSTTDKGTYSGDGVSGQLDAYSLASGTKALEVTSTKSLAGVANTLSLLGTLGGNGATASYSTTYTGKGYVNPGTDLSSAKTSLADATEVETTASSAFSGISYYHVNITATNSTVEETTVNPGTDSDGNAPGTIATDSQSDLGNRTITYSLKLDNNGNPYVDVAIVGAGSEVRGQGEGGTTAFWSGFSFDPGLSDKYVGTGRTSYTDSTGASKYSTVTTIPAYTEITKNGSCETDRAWTHEISASIELNHYFKVGSSSQDAANYYWMSVGYYSSSEGKDETGAADAYTGNLSVQLDDDHIAVLPINAGVLGSTSAATDAVVFVNNGSDSSPKWELDTTAGGTGDNNYAKAIATLGKSETIDTNKGTYANLAVGSTNYTIVFSSSADNVMEQYTAVALPSWAASGETLAKAVLAGTVKFYEGITLEGDTENKYAVAVNTATGATQTVLAIARGETVTSGTQTYTESLTATNYTYDVNTNQLAATTASEMFLDLTDDSLGDLAYIKFTFDGSTSKLTGIDYVDSNKKSLVNGSSKTYTLDITGTTGATLTQIADTTVSLTVTFTSALYSATKTGAAPTENIATSKVGTDVTGAIGETFKVVASTGGVAAGTLYDTASNVATGFGDGESLTTTSITANVVNASDVEALAALDATKSNYSGLANGTVESDSTILEVSLGGRKFYIVGELDGTTFTPSAVYNEAGVAASEDEGIYLDISKIYATADGGTNKVELAVTYDSTKKTYTVATASSANLKALATIVNMSEDGTITSTEQNIYSAAASMGFGTDYAAATDAARTDPTTSAGAAKYLNANHLTESVSSADDLTTLRTEATALTYVVQEGGNYTGIVALGSDASNGTMKSYAQLVDGSGTSVTSLYAKYTFDPETKKVSVDGLYTDSKATSLSTNANYSVGTSSDTVVLGGLTYTLSASTYSDVTISLTSGEITYDNATIKLDSSAITNSADTSATTALAFRTALDSDTTAGFQFELTGTEITSVKATTYVNETDTTVAETPLATSNTWSDSTKTYTAVWNDVNGNGTVDSNDTVTLTETPNAVTYELSAEVSLNVASSTTDTTNSTTDTSSTVTPAAYTEKFAEEDVEGTTLTTDSSSSTNSTGEAASDATGTELTTNTSSSNGSAYTLKASDTTTVHVFDAAGNEVTTDLGYTFAVVDADSNGAISDGDYFTYTSKSGDTVDGKVVSESATGTVDAYTVTRTYDGTAYAYYSDTTNLGTTITTSNGTIYTLDTATGTVTKQSGSAGSIESLSISLLIVF